MAKPKRKEEPNIVQPSIREEGVQHPMEALFDGDQSQMPTLKSIGYAKMPGTTQWVSYVITTKGKNVLLIEVDEPNARAIAEEASKINFVQLFSDQEF